MGKPTKSESKKILVYDFLKKKIIANQLTPLAPLNEAELAAELEMSKTPVREALHQLEKDGFIDNIAQKGWFVSEINIKDIRELFEVREILECAAVRLAIAKVNSDRFLVLRNKLSEMVNEKKASNLLKSGELFHTTIFENIQNKRLFDMYRSLMDHYSRARVYFVNRFDETRLAEAFVEHQKILDAILAKDTDAASELMKKHLYNGFVNITRLSLDY
jgi:DNA-binding GntR family transcriptional regulator